MRVLPPDPFPAVVKTFYALDLSRPLCLNRAMSDKPRACIRSVHVYATDDNREALLKPYRGRRVSVEFASVSEEVTAAVLVVLPIAFASAGVQGIGHLQRRRQIGLPR